MKFIILVTLLGFASACQQQARSTTPAFTATNSNGPLPSTDALGHEQGNGTDNLPFGFGSAWVAGDENEIKYCYDLASDFGADSSVVTLNLQIAFEKWKQYLIAKKINDGLENNFLESLKMGSYPDGAPQDLAAKSKLFRLTTNSKLLSNCDGSENIKFYFGSEDNDVSKIKKTYFNPTAFAFRSEYNKETGVGKGFVWIAKQGGLGPNRGGYPNWTLKNRLMGVLLHELGHVYGLPHVDGTIMQENMFGLLLAEGSTTENQKQIEYKLSHVDNEKELVVPAFETNKSAYYGEMVFGNYYNNYPDLARAEVAKNFQFFMGRKPVGQVITKFINQKIVVADAQSENRFDLKVDEKHSTYSGLIMNLFYTDRAWQPNPLFTYIGGGQSLLHFSRSTMGEITTVSGIKTPILILQNFGSTPIRITYFNDGQENALLVLNNYQD